MSRIKNNLRHDAELLCDLVAELSAQSLDIVVQKFHHFLSLGGREYADVGLGEGEVGAYPDLVTVTIAPPNTAIPLPRMISARSFWISLATLSCLVLAGFSILENVDYEVVLLAFLCEDVLPVHDILLGDLVLDVGHLILVDAHTVALNHLPGLSL